MGRWWFGGYFIAVVWLLVVAAAVEVYPVEDLVTGLPGQPKVGFKQFAGYIDVDVKNGRSLFYYFVESEVEPHKKPLTLWLNGGPGCSSVGGGAFTELGPFYPRGDGRGLRRNKMSWNKASNLLFIESPAGVGWSYSNTSSDYNCGDVSTAKDMRTFMLKWFEKFPELKSRELFLTGESYAGHYIPQLADVLLCWESGPIPGAAEVANCMQTRNSAQGTHMEANRIVKETAIFYVVRQSTDSYIHGAHQHSIHYERAITTTQLIRKKLSHSFSSHVCLYSRSLSVFPLTEPHTWAPHRGHRPGSPGTALGLLIGVTPGSPGTAPGLLIGVIAPDLPEPHLGSSSGSSPRISRNRTWAPHRGHPPDLSEPHLGSSSGSPPGSLGTAYLGSSSGSSPRISRNHLGLLPGSPGPPARIRLGLLPGCLGLLPISPGPPAQILSHSCGAL